MVSAHIPRRTCIVCRKKDEQNSLVRIALCDGGVCWDKHRIIPGRGAYVCARPVCVQRVQDNYRRCLERAFRKGGVSWTVLEPSYVEHTESNLAGG
jgi:predicted RNA-binding protein YlxR (DUF448 family)